MYYILLSLLKLLSHAPFKVLYGISDILYYPLYYVVRYRRKLVRKNLTESFPEKSMQEIKQIEKKFYHYFVDMAMEMCKLHSISPEELVKRANFVNVSLITDMLDEGKSVSVYIGHYANWEWITSTGLLFGDKSTIVQIYHRLVNKQMNEFVLKLRERFGNKNVEMRETVRYVASVAKDPTPQVIGFLADHSPKRRDAKYFINFLNHRVPVLTGTEKLTKRFGYNALFLKVTKVKRGYYEYEFVPMADNPSEMPDYELTDRYFQMLEQVIKEQPELFLWTHNRFKYAER